MCQMKAFVVSDVENLWSGFLYDNDCQSEVVRHFLQPGVNAEAASGPAIVAEARDNSQTIVTSNGHDFIRYVREAQKKRTSRRAKTAGDLLFCRT